MKLAIIGSRNIEITDFEKYVVDNVVEIVSGGAKGVDRAAKDFATRKGIKYTEFLPEYHIFGKAATLKRNEAIALYADECIAFWDGSSKGTKHTISCFKKLNKKVRIIIAEQ